eukprot:gene28259-34125_t
MDEQSFLLNDIKNCVRNGGNVTHILKVKVSRQPSEEIRNLIRQEIFSSLRDFPITKVVKGVNIAITWRTSAPTAPTYYHADVGGMYGDVAVQEHTKALLKDLLNALDDRFSNIFSNGTTGVAFLVTKPLSKKVVIVD